ncbi:MAG TPA: hypothetical protein VK625_05560, partial [Flavitalea sp.]|nr:hypothetical protein [Flavitalea sp.]
LEKTFGKNTYRRVPDSKVTVRFEKKEYQGSVTFSHNKDTTYQLFLSRDLVEKLKDRFIMSYMRSLEQKLRKTNQLYADIDIEHELPFWEFLDIEFDHTKKVFSCKAHYYQKPLFPELFKQFISSHLLTGLENRILDKGDFKFIKDNWKPKSELPNYLSRNNIIYYLIDTKNKLLYIGESKHTKRLAQARKEMPDWDYFRVDFLPEWMSKSQRIEIERLIIRSYASIMSNKREIKTLSISEYQLVNRKVDS